MDHFWDRDIAVILNANARRVTRNIVDRCKHFVPEAQLYVSKTIDEGQGYVREVVQRGYTHLVLGGGDGTVVEIINQLRKAARELGRGDASLPKLGFLKLGTGNGWSGSMGADNGKRSLPKMARREGWRLQRFNLLETEGRVYHFAGMGWDAAVLNDYFAFKERWGKGWLRKWFTGLQGYLTSMAFKTVPEQLFTRDRPKIRVICQSDEVYECKHNQPLRRLPLKTGDTLYEGPANVFGGSTTPCYGYNMVAFPFAREKYGFMNFRVVRAGVVELVTHARQIFKGVYAADSFSDYLLEAASVEIDRPAPFQIGGDPAGKRDRWDLQVSDLSVHVLDLSA